MIRNNWETTDVKWTGLYYLWKDTIFFTRNFLLPYSHLEVPASLLRGWTSGPVFAWDVSSHFSSSLILKRLEIHSHVDREEQTGSKGRMCFSGCTRCYTGLSCTCAHCSTLLIATNNKHSSVTIECIQLFIRKSLRKGSGSREQRMGSRPHAVLWAPDTASQKLASLLLEVLFSLTHAACGISKAKESAD